MPYYEARQSSIQALQSYVQILLTQQKIITGLYNQIEQWSEELPVYPLLLSIPGVGVLTAATVIGEIGDINRFPTAKHLTAFAGLDPAIYESRTATANKLLRIIYGIWRNQQPFNAN